MINDTLYYGIYDGSCQPATCPLHYMIEVNDEVYCMCYEGYKMELYWLNSLQTYDDSSICNLVSCPLNSIAINSTSNELSDITCQCNDGYIANDIQWDSITSSWQGNCILANITTCPINSNSYYPPICQCIAGIFTGEMIYDDINDQWTGNCTAKPWKIIDELFINTYESTNVKNLYYNATEDINVYNYISTVWDNITLEIDMNYTQELADTYGLQSFILSNPNDLIGNGQYVSYNPPLGVIQNQGTSFAYFAGFYLYDNITKTESERGIIYISIEDIPLPPIPSNNTYNLIEDQGIILLEFPYIDNDSNGTIHICLERNNIFKGLLWQVADSTSNTYSLGKAINLTDSYYQYSNITCVEIIDDLNNPTNYLFYKTAEDGSALNNDIYDYIYYRTWEGNSITTSSDLIFLSNQQGYIHIYVDDVDDIPRIVGQFYTNSNDESIIYINPGVDNILGTNDDIDTVPGFKILEDAAGISIDLTQYFWDENPLFCTATLLTDTNNGTLVTFVSQLQLVTYPIESYQTNSPKLEDSLGVRYVPYKDQVGIEYISFEMKRY